MSGRAEVSESPSPIRGTADQEADVSAQCLIHVTRLPMITLEVSTAVAGGWPSGKGPQAGAA